MGSCRKCIQVGSFQCDNGRAFLCSVVALVYQISVHLNSGKLGEVSVTPDGDITITVMRREPMYIVTGRNVQIQNQIVQTYLEKDYTELYTNNIYTLYQKIP